MQELNLPTYSVKLKEEDGKKFIFDEVRRKYLVLTPEEWVRQHFVNYLIEVKNYPQSLISIEKGLALNTLKKRADIVAHDLNGNPLLMVECKAPSIKITQDVFEQIARYNIVFRVPYLVVTNGLDHYCCEIDFEQNSFSFLKEIPTFTLE